jgi:hypothetical protein
MQGWARRVVLALLPAVAAGVMAGPARAHNVFVVNKPQDLRFVPMREPFLAVRSRFEGNVDLMDRLRRDAFRRISNEWGVPPADKKDVSIGCVARTDATGRLSYAVVLKGEIDPKKIQASLLDQHARAFKRRGLSPSPRSIDVQGRAAVRLPYSERASVFTLVPLVRMFLLVSTPADETSLVDEMLAALQEPGRLGQGPPPAVNLSARQRLTSGEQKRVRDFHVKNIASPVRALRDRFRKLHDKLRPEGARDEDLQSLDERITDQFLKATEFEMSLAYRPGPGAGDDVYSGHYTTQFASADEARRMRELLLEKTLFFKENAIHASIPRALDGVSVDADGTKLHVKIELDTAQKQYDAAFSYVAFLLSFSSADRFLGVSRGK